MSELPVVVNYGGGDNSTAMLIGMVERCERIDAIFTADTGSEKPWTLPYVEKFSAWLVEHGYPPVEVVRWVRKDGSFMPLHEWCENFSSLPSLAFGLRGCSVKWKRQPVDKAVTARWPTGLVVRCLGYHARESNRFAGLKAGQSAGDRWVWRAPLIEWGWSQQECLDAICRAGLPRPGKSSCWLCPAMKGGEILEMQQTNPDLVARALAIEANADLHDQARGLGGSSFSWREFLARPQMFRHRPVPSACGCADGWSSDDD